MAVWFSTNDAAKYAAVSSRTIRRWMSSGLMHSRVGGTVLIRSEWLDSFIESFAETNGDNAESIVQDIWKEISR